MRIVVRMVTAVLVGAAAMALPAAPAHADAVRDSQWQSGFLKLSQVHRITQGEGVTVAVIDSGVDATHPDLRDNVLAGIDAWSPERDGRSDQNGHGTAMASLIAGHGHGEGGRDGILGIAPKAKILPIGASLPGSNGNNSHKAVHEGIRWAVDQGVQVISLSFGGGGSSDEAAAIRYAFSKGVPVVAAAGNRPDQVTIGYPAAFPGVIAVGAVGRTGTVAPFSAAGPEMDLVAPGVEIPTARPGNRYMTTAGGTSNSTAIVAGVVALLRAKYPTMTVQQLTDLLTSTAVDKGPPGHDDDYGWGVVDPLAALTKSPKADASTPAIASPAGDGSPSPSLAAPDGSVRTLMAWVVVGVAFVVVVALALGVAWLVRQRRGRNTATNHPPPDLSISMNVAPSSAGPSPQPTSGDSAWQRPAAGQDPPPPSPGNR